MNRFIEFIKRIFLRKKLVLDKPKEFVDNTYLNQQENFLNSIKVENCEEDILLIQKQLENDFIDESKLSNEQVEKIKKLYCSQISDLMVSIKNYKLKLNS